MAEMTIKIKVILRDGETEVIRHFYGDNLHHASRRVAEYLEKNPHLTFVRQMRV